MLFSFNFKQFIFQVLKSTGFFEGLFDESELVSDNVKDRETKILFLNKVITVVGKYTPITIPYLLDKYMM